MFVLFLIIVLNSCLVNVDHNLQPRTFKNTKTKPTRKNACKYLYHVRWAARSPIITAYAKINLGNIPQTCAVFNFEENEDKKRFLVLTFQSLAFVQFFFRNWQLKRNFRPNFSNFTCHSSQVKETSGN